ncbi:MAG: putative metal-dependent hydrolase [Gemmatimonadetes bacterium]|nr:putative metal-dependent hydrolase [Gemmatimonadota bacterium]MCC6769964.1 putative metal-dependent hydrolase [Gemmatimonadaceae bacterium]
MTAPDLRYPVGLYESPAEYAASWRSACIDAIAGTPAAMRAALHGLTEAQLDTPYRPGGWTVRELTHHVPDSHLNAYIRLKLALTEDVPTIKAYDEAAWARLDDSRTTPIDVSLALLEAVHDRFVRLLRVMSDDDFARCYRHPDTGEHSLNHLTGLYAWHGRHHVAHITALRARERF